VALVIAMGGLYPCPEIIEAILNPADGQPKHILDIGMLILTSHKTLPNAHIT
jgi:hypothetical protein